MIIFSCVDSCVVFELVFDMGLGEIFVVWVVGNVVNSFFIVSIEYVVVYIGIFVIVVLGY